MSKKKKAEMTGEQANMIPALAEQNGDNYNVNTSAETVYRRNRLIKLVALILLILLLLLGISYCSMTILNHAGRFTVSIDPNEFGIQLSDSKDFGSPTLNLEAEPIENMDNITFNWILNTDLRFPDDPQYKKFEDIDKVWGDHSGTNYLAYTFGVRNAGSEPVAVDYRVTLNVVSSMKGADEAMRVAVFKDGKYTLYAKSPVKYSNGKKEMNAATGKLIRAEGIEKDYADKNFVSDSVVMTMTIKDFKPDDTDRYTVVVWLEGEDPECVNDIMGGEAKLAMNLEVLGKSGTETS